MNRKERRAKRTGNPLDLLCKRLVAKGRYATEDEALRDVIKVFGAFMSGGLAPVDGATAREVAASEAEAHAAAPELMGLLTSLARGRRPMQ